MIGWSCQLRSSAAAGALLLFCAGCSEPGCSEPAGSTTTAAGSGGSLATTTSSPSIAGTGTTSTGSAGSGGASPCPPEPLPPVVPAGWVEYPDWSCDCRFYVPGSPDVMPAPIAWEPCPLGIGSMDCRVMVTDWTDSSYPVIVDPMLDVLPSGTALLGFRRVAEEYWLELVAELDGPVRMAIMQVTTGALHPGCLLDFEDLNEGRYLLYARGHDKDGDYQQSQHGGALGGQIDDPRPTVLAHYHNDFTYNWCASASWVMRVDYPPFDVYVSPWSMAPDTHVTSGSLDPGNLLSSEWLLRGDALFWSTCTLKRYGINVWDPASGARPFIRWVGDYTKGASDLGTDGTSLVWSSGEGKQPNDTHYPVRSVMTAPFTTDPAALEPRRLRSMPEDTFCGFPWKVGCGYGAHECEGSVLIVRLADGVSWLLPSVYPEQELYWPIGVTCDEVIVKGMFSGRMSFARVRLDSLGPGMAPD